MIPKDSTRFFKIRGRFYTGLLLFVVVVGLPMIGIPSLRNRLSGRVQALKTAFAGEKAPVSVKVGENREPFPSELDWHAAVLPAAVANPSDKGILISGGVIYRAASPSSKHGSPVVYETDKLDVLPQPTSVSGQNPAENKAPEAAISDEPQYAQGKQEQEAYNILLKMNSAAANIVQGNDPSRKFKSWAATKREDGVYWVRFKILTTEKQDVDYIWQVRIETNQVIPLSHSARSLGAAQK
jgi:hypothetical protein